MPSAPMRRLPLALLSVLALLAGLVGLAGPASAVPGTGSNVWINEIHYDNDGTDAGESIEVVAPAGTDLSAWSLVLYNGTTPSAATTYDTDALGVAGSFGNGWGSFVLTYPSNGLQNGNNDGVALVNSGGTVVQLLSYEGTLTASNGPAAGQTSTDIGQAEASATPLGQSLQLTGGPGDDPSDFSWAAPATNTFGTANTGQSFVTTGEDSAPSVSSTSPADEQENVVLDSNVTVNFSEPVDVAGTWYTLTCSVSGAHTATVSGGPTTYTLDPDTDFAFGDECDFTVVAAQVTDQDTNDPPNTMAEDHSIVFAAFATDPCDAAYTPAYEIQGSGTVTPKAGQTVTTEGIVVGDHEGSGRLRGFYLQDETGDGDPATSDAVFVFQGNFDQVALGDRVRVTGIVNEFQDQTQLNNGQAPVSCGTGTVAPTDVTLPELPDPAPQDLERYEGMLTRFPQTLTVNESFQLGRFGQVTVSSSGRLFTPTHVVEPGAAAIERQADNNATRLIIDDSMQTQNPDPILFSRTGGPLSADNTLRMGDTATGTVGVLTYTWSGNSASGNAFRLRPFNALGGAIDFVAANPRPAQPADVGGTVKVAAVNVLNYFNSFDDFDDCFFGVGGAPSDCRGADNAFEFERQEAKIVNELIGLDADVVGLMEIENDGYGAGSAIQDLADAVNAAGGGPYEVIDPDTATGEVNSAGTDAIKVGLLYRPTRVEPVGDTAVLNTGAFGQYTLQNGSTIGRHRPAVTQAFQDTESGEAVVVAVNHFKSKGSGCADNAAPVGPDPDTGDGQGNCNLTRRAAAQELTEWLAGDPTGTGDPDALIIGDLNSYAMEDPIRDIEEAGYTNLIKEFLGDDAYSFVFDGQSGYLDHALGNESVVPQVTGVTEWHANADEPTVLDYNTNFKTDNQIATYYSEEPFRSSDHDPVLIGLDLGACQFSDSGTTRTLLGDCSTSETIEVPDGWTLDGDGHTITAHDPVGGHFTGAVVANAGDEAHVRNLTVTAHELADVCDGGVDRLRGIMFDGAAGSITGNQVLDLRQHGSGCQEGNAIEVRNAPFDNTGPDLTVTVTDNVVRDYQKTGILANGSVVASILRNTVDGLGPVGYIAQNGVQVGFGATGAVDGNTISDNFYTGPDVACGLLFFEADGVKQKRNTFSGNEQDLCNFGRGGGGVSSAD